MTADLDMLRVMHDHGADMDYANQLTVLAAAMPGVHATLLRDAWDAVADLVADAQNLDPRTALDRLKDAGRIGGGHNPHDAYTTVLGELEQAIAATVRDWTRRTERAA